MTKTKISWATDVWNPIVGCKKVSPGCAHCYAERMAKRLKEMGRPEYQDVVDDKGRWTGKITLVHERLEDPLHWKKPRRVFVNSMSDLFHEDVPSSFIAQVFATMAIARWHKFLILTKRPQRMLNILSELNFDHDIEAWQEQFCYETGDCPQDFDYPLPNVWLGVSVENQKTAYERIPLLLKTPAAVRFVSCEPLLGPVDLLKTYGQGVSELMLDHLDWVIVGGESGPAARPMELSWASTIVDQCKNADVACYMKQLGGYPDKHERVEEWPQALQVQEFPKGENPLQPPLLSL